MWKFMLAAVMAIGLSGCLGSGGGGNKDGWSGWDMDPRLEAIQLWVHAAGAIVVEVDQPDYVPPVQGVDGTWGSNNAFGTYYGGKGWQKSMVRIQIDRPSERHVVDIAAHEIGHFYKHLLEGNPNGEDYANWVNTEIRKLEAAGLIPPAPGIDWDAVSSPLVKEEIVDVLPVEQDEEEEPTSKSDDKD